MSPDPPHRPAPSAYINIARPRPSFSQPSKCSGLTLVSEDSSETAFLLVENYNYDRFCWPSGRQGIFGKPLRVHMLVRLLFIGYHSDAVLLRKRY